MSASRATALSATLLLALALLPVVHADDAPKEPASIIYPVQTELHKELLPGKPGVYVLIDTTEALEGGKVALRPLNLPELRKALLPHKKADTQLHFNLFFKRTSEDASEDQAALRLALMGFGHEAGFAKVTAIGTYLNFTGKPRQPKGAEPATASGTVKAYPVRTDLSRHLTSDADCAVIVPSLAKEGGTIPKKVRDAVADAVAKLKLPNKKRIAFFTDHGPDNVESLLGEFDDLTKELKFEMRSIVSFR
jgi:hypothetical protein